MDLKKKKLGCSKFWGVCVCVCVCVLALGCDWWGHLGFFSKSTSLAGSGNARRKTLSHLKQLCGPFRYGSFHLTLGEQGLMKDRSQGRTDFALVDALSILLSVKNKDLRTSGT